MKKENKTEQTNLGYGMKWYMDKTGSRLLTKEEEQQLARAAQSGDRQARHQLILRNMGLVYKEANKHRGFTKSMEIRDLVQEGVFGLSHAVNQFDPDRGTRFSTCATWWIRQRINRAINDQDHLIAIPDRVCEDLKKARKIRNDAETKTGFELSDQQLFGALKTDAEFLTRGQKVWDIQSFSDPVGDDDSTVEDYIPDAGEESAEDSLLEKSHRSMVWRRFASLKPLEVQIMDLSYGIFRTALPNDWQIAHQLGLHQKQVPEIRDRALEKLRRMDWSDVLEDLPCGA